MSQDEQYKSKSAYHPLTLTGKFIEVDDVQEIRTGFNIRKFRFLPDASSDTVRNAVLEIQLNREKTMLINKDYIGLRAVIDIFLNGITSSTGKIHTCINCTKVTVVA
jgi:hypothetical protein